MTHVEQTVERHLEADDRMTRAAIAAVMATPEGRTIFRWFEDASGVWSTAPGEERDRAAWIGRRALGLFVLDAFRDAAFEPCLQAERERRDIAARRTAELDQAWHLDNPNTQHKD